jgi:hypothetical protein
MAGDLTAGSHAEAWPSETTLVVVGRDRRARRVRSTGSPAVCPYLHALNET